MDLVESSATTRWPLVGRREEVEQCVAALATGEVRAVFVHGAAGVGKSRLAEEIVQQLTGCGWTTMWVRASVASSAIPLGALAHLLPTDLLDRRFDPLSVYGGVVAGLRAGRAERGRLIILVDDVQWLDPTAAALLGQLMDGGEVGLVGTVRSGEPAPEAVSGLWNRSDASRIDLRLLTFEDVDTLLHLVLGGPVDQQATNRIWAASKGNALYVRELVLGALARGQLVERRGVWWLAGPLATTPRLAEIVGQRIGDLAGPPRGALEVISVWDLVGLEELASTFGSDAVETLERAGLAEVRVDGRRHTVGLAHPLHGEVVRAALATMTRRRILLERADRLAGYGGRRREDLLQIATARLEGGGAADPELLTNAARVARYGHDYALVDRLTAAVVSRASPRAGARSSSVTERPSAEAVLLRAEALHELGEYAEVEALLADWPVRASGDERLDVQLVAMRVRNLFWGLYRADEALRVNRDARRQFTDRNSLDELITDEALTFHHSNRPADALVALEQMSDDPSPRARVLRAIVAVPALTATGRCETAVEASAAAYAEHRQLGDQTAIAPAGVHFVHRMNALLEAGRLAEARAIASRGYERASRGGPPLARDWYGLGLGRAALLGGQPRSAARWLAECAELSSRTGFDGPRRLELSYLATALAWCGELARARSSVEEADGLSPSWFHEAEQQLGSAWARVAAGDLDGGRRVLLASAAQAESTDHRWSAAWLLHDVARLGAADTVVARLEALVPHCEGALVPAFAASARALATRDGEALDDVATRFEAMDMFLVAAEASTAAADSHRRAGRQRSATASLARARSLAARCEGARTPGLVSADSLVPLTRRERQIGTLAAAGHTSKAIATQLFLSVRTVENHLQNVYTKLGVSSRSELADALGAPPAQ